MSYEKDKELMQEIHNLIDDYNYLNKVIPIIKETYIKERINFYVQTVIRVSIIIIYYGRKTWSDSDYVSKS